MVFDPDELDGVGGAGLGGRREGSLLPRSGYGREGVGGVLNAKLCAMGLSLLAVAWRKGSWGLTFILLMFSIGVALTQPSLCLFLPLLTFPFFSLWHIAGTDLGKSSLEAKEKLKLFTQN